MSAKVQRVSRAPRRADRPGRGVTGSTLGAIGLAAALLSVACGEALSADLDDVALAKRVPSADGSQDALTADWSQITVPEDGPRLAALAMIVPIQEAPDRSSKSI